MQTYGLQDIRQGTGWARGTRFRPVNVAALEVLRDAAQHAADMSLSGGNFEQISALWEALDTAFEALGMGDLPEGREASA